MILRFVRVQITHETARVADLPSYCMSRVLVHTTPPCNAVKSPYLYIHGSKIQIQTSRERTMGVPLRALGRFSLGKFIR